VTVTAETEALEARRDLAIQAAHDWRNIWSGFHMQFECSRCKQRDDFLYESGERVGTLPTLECIAA